MAVSLQDAEWYEAFGLHERSALFAGPPDPPAAAIDTDLAEKRARRWSSQRPFELDANLERRLRSDGLTRDRWLRLLGEPPANLRDRCPEPPRWLEELVAALGDRSPVPRVSALLADQLKDQRVAFLDPLSQLIHRARKRLRRGLDRLTEENPRAPFDPASLEGGFLIHLIRQLVALISPVMVLELHVARHRELLGGESAEEQFASFAERIRDPEVAEAIFKEYPVLARRLSARTAQWAATSLELVGRLCEDLAAIRETFCGGQHPGKVDQLSAGLGDRHRGGRSVVTLRFDSGLRLVYKPRSLAVDVSFQKLLEWCNRFFPEAPFRTLEIVDRETHGWVEHVTPEECRSAGEVARFFERQGRFLALFYVLRATDFHFENLIAAGEHPVPIDLESLFHPDLEIRAPRRSGDPGAAQLGSSVLMAGLLPQRMFQHGGSEGVDVSGLGAREGQLTPREVPVWEKTGTAEMRLTKKRMPFTSGSHTARLRGAGVDILDYLDALTAGFAAMYRALADHREALLAAGGPLGAFESCEVRVIARPTRAYGLLVQESVHPDLLRSALDRDRFFDRLWMDVEYRPYLDRLVPFEQEALRADDVPIFTTRPGSRSLWTSSGREIRDLLEKPSLDLVRSRIRRLSDEDLERQCWLIRASVATLCPQREGDATLARRLEDVGAAGSEGWIAMAREIAKRLERTAIRQGDDVGWLGLKHVGKHLWVLAPAELDLFDGLPGIALFFAYLGELTGEERYRHLAETILGCLRRRLAQSEEKLSLIGAFEGWGGAIYLLTHLAVVWRRPDLLREARAMAERLPDLIDRDRVFDVIGGCAGCIASLLALHAAAPAEDVLVLAVRCGDRLLAGATELEQGLGWVTPIAPRPLSGFAHGAAGIAWALAELAAAAGAARFQEAAARAVAFERSLYSPQAKNWRDPRSEPSEDGAGEAASAVAWCYGAAGIGLARLRSARHLADEQIRADVDAALETTIARGFGYDHSLNQGDLGNLELLVEADRRPEVGRRLPLAAVREKVIASLARTGPRCATPLGIECPGLMTGLAGIGYGLLRLAAPGEVPSVLVLEGPRAD
jgi:type 2 lantibiotic biosynthesis protein LanM